MTSQDLFAPTLELLRRAFRTLEARVPPPKRMVWKDGFVFRYSERTIHQAIVLKLARIVSSLHAVESLLGKGLFQEQGMIQRALDEIGEDIDFLSFAVIFDDYTERHKQYLEYFYAEEFDDPSDILGSHRSRGMVSREKIRNYVNAKLGSEAQRANVVGKILTKAYSGFIHAASPHIMDMYGGVPPRFDLSGEFGDFRMEEHADDALNYFLRAIFTMAIAAKAFGDEPLFADLRERATELESKMYS